MCEIKLAREKESERVRERERERERERVGTPLMVCLHCYVEESEQVLEL
jgi:hypothetical protein